MSAALISYMIPQIFVLYDIWYHVWYKHETYDIMYYIIYFMVPYMISYMKHILDHIWYHIWYHTWYHDDYTHFLCLAAADPPPAQHADATDDDHDPDRPMDFDLERDLAAQGPVTDMDMEEDPEMLSLMLKHNIHLTIPYRLPTRSGTGATATGSTRGTSGCGATAGAAPGWCGIGFYRWSGPRGSAKAGSGRQWRGSVTARLQPHRGRPMWQRIALDTGLWYHKSYHSQYHIWYHRYDMNYIS